VVTRIPTVAPHPHVIAVRIEILGVPHINNEVSICRSSWFEPPLQVLRDGANIEPMGAAPEPCALAARLPMGVEELSLDATLCWNVVHRGRFKNRSPASWLAKAWKKLGKKRR